MLWWLAKDWNARELLSPHGKEWRSSNLRVSSRSCGTREPRRCSQWVEKPDGQRVRLTEETGAGTWAAIVSEGMFRALVHYLSDPKRNTGGGGKHKALFRCRGHRRVDVECMSHTGLSDHRGFRRICTSFAMVVRAKPDRPPAH
ncbi:hypothetical protein U9R90_23460 [Streptomyces sp. E11-3]|uniref:hypothetical protein n=1 Tax=Streptomyces sp. E11-3 TaxID=3110112 RepID=UPI00397FEDA5